MDKKPMTKDAAKRIQRNADKKPGSSTANTDFKKRAQRAADKRGE